MSGKRQATTNLNHDNWDQEDSPEERGTFRVAAEDELKNRVMKKARRTITCKEDGEEGASTSKSIFGNFKGFGSAPPVGKGDEKSSLSVFSFLSKIPTSSANNVCESGSSTVSNNQTSIGAPTINKEPKISEEIKINAKPESVATPTSAEKSSGYHAKLKGLNMAVSSWIKTHVDTNPLCILTPIFKDYEKYLNDIEKEENINLAGSSSDDAYEGDDMKSSSDAVTAKSMKLFATSAPSGSDASSEVKPKFSFGAATAVTTSGGLFDNIGTKTNDFTLNFMAKEKSTVPASTFTFSSGGSPSASTLGGTVLPSTSGFSFALNTKPFQFDNIKDSAGLGNCENPDEEELDDQPPKVEFKQVVEDDAIVTKKCKLFVKKDNKFNDHGVGTLYLKPIKESNKTQLLVRADTNLGNILVNLILSSAIPVQRVGKNNVMMVCLPMPDVEKPTPMLLRVKTETEADELFEIIEKHRK